MTKEINIKSSTINKGIDLIKGFVNKLIGPTMDEIGLLMSDNIKFYRFKNQVSILIKAKKYVESRNIDVRHIPIKILVPLLENASLEENSDIQEKWSNMIGNLADSEQNLQNQVFPYLLSQISLEEYNSLLKLNQNESDYLITHANMIDLKKALKYPYREIRELENDVRKIQQDGFWVKLEEFELANLQRLGLIKQLPPKIIIDEFKTGDYDQHGEEEWHQIDAEYDPDEYGHRITELGIKFLNVCESKKE